MSMLNILLGSGGKTFKALWSGNSLALHFNIYYKGIETSGNAWRWYDNNGVGAMGTWQSVSLSGIFSGSSLRTCDSNIGIVASSNQLYPWYIGFSTSGICSFDVNTQSFSGNSSYVYNDGEGGIRTEYMGTSGGLIRYGIKEGVNTYYGAYISLT